MAGSTQRSLKPRKDRSSPGFVAKRYGVFFPEFAMALQTKERQDRVRRRGDEPPNAENVSSRFSTMWSYDRVLAKLLLTLSLFKNSSFSSFLLRIRECLSCGGLFKVGQLPVRKSNRIRLLEDTIAAFAGLAILSASEEKLELWFFLSRPEACYSMVFVLFVHRCQIERTQKAPSRGRKLT